MRDSTNKLAALSAAHSKLSAKLFSATEEQRSLTRSDPTSSRQQQKLGRLATEIESLKQRLDRCEKAMESALCEPL